MTAIHLFTQNLVQLPVRRALDEANYSCRDFSRGPDVRWLRHCVQSGQPSESEADTAKISRSASITDEHAACREFAARAR